MPIGAPLVAVEAILRQPRRVLYQLSRPGTSRLTGVMLTVAVLCGLLYGVVMGTFSMGGQLWATPVKIAIGLLISGLICLPSLYIFACLSGSQAGFREILGLVAGLVMLIAILLIGFAPVAWVFSQSTNSVSLMGALHLGFWFIGALFGLRFLAHGFSASKARSHAGLWVWSAIFILVALQMTTALRPLVGTADTFLPKEKKFFAAHWADCLKADAERTRAQD